MAEVAQLQFTDVITVEVLKTDFDDKWPCLAAWTSTKGIEATPERKAGLINRLIAERHGSPFEHMAATMRVTAPIFVWREHHRHRVGFSYSEESGRYKVLEPVFYVPGEDRHLAAVEGTKQMDYITSSGSEEMQELVAGSIGEACGKAYACYEEMLRQGVLREVARMVLPVSIMSTCVVTMNARSLMHFLSLRTRDEQTRLDEYGNPFPPARFPSKPMKEINIVADGYERMFRDYAPITHEAFCRNGRVAP